MIENPERALSFLSGRVLVLLLAASLWAPLGAQESESPLSPAGRLRLEVAPTFQSWSRRFGETGTELLGRDLADATGALLFPGIATLEARLREVVGDPGYQAVLGSSRAEVSASRIRLPLRADFGVLDRLTVGVTVPIVRNRTEIAFAFRADSATANLGVSPAVTRPTEVVAFTDELRGRVQAATARAGQLCGQAPGSAECASASQAAQSGDRLLAGFLSSYAASPFYPLGSSATGETLQQLVTAFNQSLTSLGLTPLSSAPLFASARLSAAALDQLFSDAAVGLNTLPLRDRVGIWELGDVEVHAAVRLLEGTVRDSPAAPARLAYLLGGGVLVRLGTGFEDDPDVSLDLSGGDGQMDLEGRVFSSLRAGRYGLWGDVRYGVQRSRTVERRIGPQGLVLVPAVNRSTLEWTPGSYLQLELAPRYHLTQELAITGGYLMLGKGEDSFIRVSPEPAVQDRAPLPSPPIFTDASLLAEGTAATVHELGGGLVFSSLQARNDGRASLPFEARLNVRWAVAGSGVNTPKGVRATMGLRLYRRFWGS